MKKIIKMIAYVIILTKGGNMIQAFPDEHFFPDMHNNSMAVEIEENSDPNTWQIDVTWDGSIFRYVESDENIHYFEYVHDLYPMGED